MAQFNRIAIIGVGLIGGSIGIAVRRRRLAHDVLGYSRRAATLRRAIARRAIHRGTTRLADVASADLVILATPVSRLVPLGRELLRHMRPGAILTDVGSTKGIVTAALEGAAARRGLAFVGGHPLAGSEQRGIAAANSALFAGTTVILTPTPRTNRRALQRVSTFWRSLGARVTRMAPQQHDHLLAEVSHMPHALACALVRSAAGARGVPPLRSFLEMTRIAKSDPGRWETIFRSNRVPLLRAMSRFDREWRALRRDVRDGRPAALQRRLAVAQTARRRLDAD